MFARAEKLDQIQLHFNAMDVNIDFFFIRIYEGQESPTTLQIMDFISKKHSRWGPKLNCWYE